MRPLRAAITLAHFAALLSFSLFIAQAGAQAFVVDNRDAVFSNSQGLRVPILMYHGLDAAHGYDPADFGAHMQALADRGFETITLDLLRAWILDGTTPLPERPIVLTFDDNYLSVYTVAFPALHEHGFVGYNFAHTHYVGVAPGGSPPTGFDHADWIEIAEMETAGTMLTESHTETHRNLTLLGLAELRQELGGSLGDIEANLPGKIVRHLAYPYGAHNDLVVAETAAAGYETAVTTIAGYNDRSTPLLRLRRHGVTPDTSLGSLNTILDGAAGADWPLSQGAPGYWAEDYALRPAGTGANKATFSVELPTSGLYEVSAWWAENSNRASNAPYTIRHARGAETRRMDQRTDGGQWNSLGSYSFRGGETAAVSLTDDADGYVIADAVRFELIHAQPVGSYWAVR